MVPILTKGGAQFIAPLTLAGLAEHPVYQDLFSLKDEAEMGHIRLAREADLILVAPASADLIGRRAAVPTCLPHSRAPPPPLEVLVELM